MNSGKVNQDGSAEFYCVLSLNEASSRLEFRRWTVVFFYWIGKVCASLFYSFNSGTQQHPIVFSVSYVGYHSEVMCVCIQFSAHKRSIWHDSRCKTNMKYRQCSSFTYIYIKISQSLMKICSQSSSTYWFHVVRPSLL